MEKSWIFLLTYLQVRHKTGLYFVGFQPYGLRIGDFQAYAVRHFWAILLSASVLGVAV